MLLVGLVLPASSSTPETMQDEIIRNIFSCKTRSHGERLSCFATQIGPLFATELKGFEGEISIVKRDQLQQVLGALTATQQLVKGVLKRQLAAAPHRPLHSGSRQMLQTDPCADPNSTCGILPAGSTRSPAPAPMPSWVGCVDQSDEVVSQAANAWGFLHGYSCSQGKLEGACSLAIAAKLCPLTCDLCRTPPYIHLLCCLSVHLTNVPCSVQPGSVHGHGAPQVLMGHSTLRPNNFATVPRIVETN